MYSSIMPLSPSLYFFDFLESTPFPTHTHLTLSSFKGLSHFAFVMKSCSCIVVCLDTSWSMAGPRENLAKAVVLECSKQGKILFL